VAQLHAGHGARQKGADIVVEGVLGIGTVDGALVGLLELVAIGRTFQRVGEVRVQVEVGAQRVGRDLGAAVRRVDMPVAREAGAVGLAAGGGV
jgi:hypothetical protein